MKTVQSVSADQLAPGNRIRVRAASHATIRFDSAVPAGAQLVVEYRNRGRLLARECRTLPAGSESIEIKTHPRASHIVCLLQCGGRTTGIRGKADIGPRIESIGRYFIVIGAMKAGTTTLFNLLARHPAICRTWVEVPGVSFSKEINYFRSLYRKRHTASHYDWRFPFDRSRHSWTLDVSPGYAKWPGSKAVPRRIASMPGEVRLAYLLRDPIDRIESHLAHSLRHRGEIRSLQHCIRTSSYALQLDKFMMHIDRGNVLLLDFEELQRNAGAVSAKVCDFLGIERIPCQNEVHNTRGIHFELDAMQRTELAKALRPDVRRLIDVYGFTPAEKWLRSGSFNHDA